uniref:Uncharacterized protein n=1 Tax=Setaria italica TaxID=4555 RepID=K3Z1J0_SETIT
MPTNTRSPPHVATVTSFVFEVITTRTTRETAWHPKKKKQTRFTNEHTCSTKDTCSFAVQPMLLPCIYTLAPNNLHELSYRSHLKL